MSIADIRREYNLAGLRRRDLDGDAIVQFRRWFDQATGARASGRIRSFLIRLYKTIFMIRGVEQLDLNAMTLATADRQGRPSARIVLLKGLDQRGFIFFTNYNSRKGHELKENPEAALVFYWPEQERQVCVAGRVNKVPQAESEAYFRTRPRGSRIAAWASDQSEVMKDRVALEARWKQFEDRYPGEDIPCPPYWGGYVLDPMRLEFWQGRPNRLHDRFRYSRKPDRTWLIERLSP
ncbi:MAG TPA: pyridoxamine 5'-phosphate oxidase [Verrucomicrobiae bacterium]|nr:pyridoxamine 5'-phosphate oxidase [Verrucomicrobiae bacterium]